MLIFIKGVPSNICYFSADVAVVWNWDCMLIPWLYHEVVFVRHQVIIKFRVKYNKISFCTPTNCLLCVVLYKQKSANYLLYTCNVQSYIGTNLYVCKLPVLNTVQSPDILWILMPFLALEWKSHVWNTGSFQSLSMLWSGWLYLDH